MRKAILGILFWTFATASMALTIPQGTFYFDNSQTNYTHVKFVYGSDSRAETYVCSMTLDSGSRWKITFDAPVDDMYRYTFADITLADGKIDSTFSVVKEYISNSLSCNRTATTDATILVNGIYVPASGDNWAQGSWQTLDGQTHDYSGTLPVMFINTEGGVEITSKDEYVSATYYVDPMTSDYESIGSETEQLPLEIRGRGNYTWSDYNKKPYRIKLGDKQNLLGMNSSKHFALLAHADDDLGFLRNTVGFELSRRMGLSWTPEQRPIEVVLNGNYIGLYMLTETIRVSSKRVNISDQANYETDAEAITGGWLVELDNYNNDPHISLTEGNGENITVTYKTPDTLSSAQINYLQSQFEAMNSAIYYTDKSSTTWENLIDLDTLARFYVVQEIMDNAESFHGSCYLHKEKGYNTKWVFGPVWDFGNSYHRSYSGSDNQFIYVDPPFGQTWIGEIAQYPRFQAKVRAVWKQFKGNNYSTLQSFIDQFCNEIYTAAQYNYKRWPNYGNYNITERKNQFISNLTNRIAWLVEQWGDATALTSVYDEATLIFSPRPGELQIESDNNISSIEIYDISGQLLDQSTINSNNATITCSSGLRIIKLFCENGQVSVKKVVIK